MNRQNVLKLAVIAALTLSAPLIAAEGPPTGGEQRDHAAQLAMFDLDGDGRITREEVEQVKAGEFQGADLDASGYLDLAELAALEGQHRALRLQDEFAFLDADADGLVSAEEFLGMPEEGQPQAAAFVFQMAAGEDGLMTLEELGTLRGPEGQLWRLYARLDRDLDGAITLEEYAAPPSMAGPATPPGGGQPTGPYGNQPPGNNPPTSGGSPRP